MKKFRTILALAFILCGTLAAFPVNAKACSYNTNRLNATGNTLAGTTKISVIPSGIVVNTSVLQQEPSVEMEPANTANTVNIAPVIIPVETTRTVNIARPTQTVSNTTTAAARVNVPSASASDSKSAVKIIGISPTSVKAGDPPLYGIGLKMNLTIVNQKTDLVKVNSVSTNNVELQGGIMTVNQSVVTENVSVG